MDLNKYLIIGGSTKCGTTSVFNYFEYHPQVCACLMKESRYFWTDEYPLSAVTRSTKKINRFSDLFKDCRPDQLRMEATPDYLYAEPAAAKIRNELPNCKMLFILREPVSRLISWYNFAVLNGLLTKQTTFGDYIHLQSHTSATSWPQHLRGLEQGRYASYLEHYISTFGKENVLVTFYEELVANPENFCKNISRFAGIDENFFNGFEFKIFNKTLAAKSTHAHGLFRKLKRTFRPVTRIFHPAIRKNIKLAGYHVESAYLFANKGSNTTQLQPDAETQLFLDDYYSEDKIMLQQLTGNKVPW